ncbi:DUF3810 domain-containing protein [Mangrovibacterium diazotrophicum]|uniref:Uncharacterized protein n=1 Tax=Mangrovibacterium diazotrophicum TaxID=1261403 RepID=A0A419W410_9BACT|nr:DUF3810 domain-containing protein [Mangrovibacterium diazotrophicum]RKD90191.1 hypothetical protein BC643_0527 [Mangrovibacterium diazotrophicum]
MYTGKENRESEQEILEPDGSIAALIGKILFFSPGLLILIVAFSAKLGQSNPFVMLILFLLGGIVGLIGFIVYLVAAKGLKGKILTILTGIIFYVSVLPIIWGVNGLRERIYVYNNREKLEIIANNLLTDQISVDEANEMLKSEGSILTVVCVPEEHKHVLFLLGGMIDNCAGFSYSLTDDKPLQNCCGDLVSWKKILTNWYKWRTT